MGWPSSEVLEGFVGLGIHNPESKGHMIIFKSMQKEKDGKYSSDRNGTNPTKNFQVKGAESPI